MAATIKIYECSSSVAGTDKTSSTVRFKLADDVTIDTNDPITIPSTGYKRSYSKQLRLYCDTAPDTQIDNLKAYSDGTSGFGTGIVTNGSNVGGTFSANATSAIADGTDLFAKTSVDPFDIDAVHTAAVTTTGFFGDILKLQCVVASSATSGTKVAETLTYAYDEI